MKGRVIGALFLAVMALAGGCSAERDNKYDPKSSNYLTVMVSFDSQGGSAVAAQTTGYNRCAEAPAEPIRTGYTFGGWYRDSSYTEKWHFPTNRVDNDITLYARWLANPCTVTYDSQGGSGVGPETVEYGDLISVPSEPVLTGYTFDAWYRELACVTPWVFASDTIAGDMTLYAGWVINTYTLTYTAGSNGSLSGTTSQVVNYNTSGSAVTAIPDTGYHFVQWNDGSTANPRTDSSVSAAISVSAMFAINTYTLTYTAGSNGSISGSTTQVVNYGSSGSAVTAVANTGYHFVQWSDGSTANPRTDSGVSADKSVTASFAINTYTLTYTAGSNGTISGTTPQNVNHGSNGTTVTAVPNTGYHFDQWSDGGLIATRTDTNVTANLSLTASFAINTYTLTYTAGANGSISGSTTQVVNYGSSGSSVTAVANTGYHFVQWSDGVLTATRTDSSVIADKSVTASFAVNTYYITFNSNGGTGSMSTQSMTYGSTASLSTNTFTRTGFDFKGWSLTSGGAVAYADGASYTMGAGDVTLYACWKRWTRLSGVASRYTRGYGIYSDSSGYQYVTGVTNGNLGGQTLNGSNDAFVMKYDTSGNKLWTRLTGSGSSDTIGRGIYADTSGNSYTVGQTDGSLDGQTGSGGYESFITKYNTSGTWQWTRLAGGTTYGYAITGDSSGNVYATGVSYSNLNGQTLTGSRDMFLVKYDSAGSIQWTRLLGVASSMTDGWAICGDSSGNTYIAGGTNGNLDGQTLSGSWDVFVTMYNTSGTRQWTRLIGVAGSGMGVGGIAYDSTNSRVYVTGSTSGNLHSQTLTGTTDAFISRYDTSGTRQWTRLLGVSGQATNGGSSFVDSSGNIYLVGTTYGNLDGQTLTGAGDVFVTKYDASGTRLWTILLGVSGASTNSADIDVDSSGITCVTGYTAGNLDGQTLTGNPDVFVTTVLNP